MARIPSIPTDQYTPEQLTMFEDITGGSRGQLRPKAEFLNAEGGVGGPFHPWMHTPVLGNKTQSLGAAVRFENSLTARCREIAILVVAAHTKAHYEWWAHAKIASKEGVDDALLESIAREESPAFTDPMEAAVYAASFELVKTDRLSDANYAAVQKLIGNQGIVDLVITVGYYGLVSLTLNTFEIALPEGEKPVF